MSAKKFLDEIVQKFGEKLPKQMKPMKESLEKNLHQILQSTFANLHLVTFEEFTVQQKILERAEKKLAALEKKVKTLENAIKKPGSRSKS